MFNEKILDRFCIGDRKILIVGVRHSNFDKTLQSNTRLRFLYKDDTNLSRITSIPSDVGLILITRFISHKIQRKILSVKPPDILFIKHAFETGELKRFVSTVLVPKPITISATMQKRNDRGVVEKWLVTHIDLTVQDINSECQRLIHEAKSNGLVTSEVYLRRRIKKMLESSAVRERSGSNLRLVPIQKIHEQLVGHKEKDPTPSTIQNDVALIQDAGRKAFEDVELRGLGLLDDLRELLRVAILEIDVVRAEYELLKMSAKK